ncbi:MAG: hypothetical protein ACSHWS_02385 [Sulfitobacter sp.]
MRIIQTCVSGIAALMIMSGVANAQSSDGCGAIYREARDTKSCIAYEAFVLTCASHDLLPVAKLFLQRQCGGEVVAPAKPLETGVKPARKPAPEHDCDRMAGHPDDPDKVGDGIAFKDIRVKEATFACHHAIGRYSREPRFRFQLGRIYDKAKDFDNAAHGYSDAAERGHARAMASLAILHRNGEGFEKSEVNAFLWEVKAAEAGYVPLMHVVAKAFAKGEVTNRDSGAAFKWNLKSAEAGMVEGMVAVAYYYKEGIGVEKDGRKAREWYIASARKGSGWGRQMLANMYDNGTGGPRDPEEAARHLVDALRDCSSVVVDNLTGDYDWFEMDTISALQRNLAGMGVYVGKVDGRLGPKTTAAIDTLCG